LDDEPRPGRPPIDFLDIQILSSPEKQPFQSAYSLAEILDISHTTPLNHLRDSLGMKFLSFTLDTQSVDGPTSRQQDSEMSGVATITRKDGGK
jgi:hypothetical protein